MPIHLLIPELRRHAAALLLWPLALCAGEPALPDGLYAEIATPRGTLTCELEYARAPLTVANFVGLAEGSLGPSPRRPFFDGLTFHRVVPYFVVQGGDPLGTGAGGPGYTFPDEFAPGLRHDAAGVLSMANEGPDTNGSQFFITLAPVERLDFLHAVFGRTVRGADVLPRIAAGDAMHVRILRIGAAATAFSADEAAVAALSAKTPKYAAERDAGPAAHFDDPDKLLPTDPPRAQNFSFKLANVERATGQRIDARVFAKFVPGAPGQEPAGFADALAQRLGLGGRGVLAVYFADRDEWTLSVGTEVMPRFTGEAQDPTGRPQKVVFPRAMAQFLAESRARNVRYLESSKLTLANILQTPGQKIKVSVDATLDELIAKMRL